MRAKIALQPDLPGEKIAAALAAGVPQPGASAGRGKKCRARGLKAAGMERLPQ